MALSLTQTDSLIRANRSPGRSLPRLAFFGLARPILALLLAAATNLSLAAPWQVEKTEREIKAIADGVLTLMSFTILPDVTTSRA